MNLEYQFSSVQFSRSVVSNSLRPHKSQHARPPHPLPTPWVHSNSCPLSQWCHPTISSSVVTFPSCPQSFPASGSFPNQFFTSGGQSIGVSASASVLSMNIQDWSPLGCTGWVSLQSKGLSRVFSNTAVQKHQFFGAQPSLWSSSHVHTCICVVSALWQFLAKLFTYFFSLKHHNLLFSEAYSHPFCTCGEFEVQNG